MFAARFASLVAAVWTSAAFAGAFPHIDVQLSVVNGSIDTGSIDFDTPGNPVIPGVRVFTATLGEGFPHFSPRPGFTASPGSGLPAGSTLSFNIVDALRKFDPIGVDFDEVPAETMTINLAAASRTTPADPGGFVEGFAFTAASATGSVHQHLNFFLNPPQTTGVYVLALELVSSSPMVGASEPFYIVFNEGASEAEHEAAAEALEALLTPTCPGDTDNSGSVDVDDLNNILSNWLGMVVVGSPVDLANDDGVVDVDDLNVVLANWQAVCQ